MKKWVYGMMVVLAAIMLCGCSSSTQKESERIHTSYVEYGSLKSKLKNKEECYLCGSENKSSMGYYRDSTAFGVIALNEWYVLDFHLEEGNDSTNTIQGRNGDVTYQIDARANRGMSHITVSSEKEFDDTVARKNLCQECLDKVTETLFTYCAEGEKPKYQPFVLVDFETLELYTVQRESSAQFIKDYWVEVECEDDVRFSAYYLPERTE